MLKNKKKKGFTLIELIVVIAILGILAAVTIPRFTGFQANANVKSVKSTLKNIDTAAATVAAEKNISLSSVTEADVATALGWAAPDASNNFTGTSPNGVTYTLNASGLAEATVAGTVQWPSGLTTTPTSADLLNK